LTAGRLTAGRSLTGLWQGGVVAKGKQKKVERTGKHSAPLVEPASAAAGPSDSTVPCRYDMPYTSPSPRLVNSELGLHNLVARAGHNAAYSIDVTLLDSPDHRLIRSGVLLAHRVLDGRGEWFMDAPDWQPLLPEDRIEPMGDADLPDEFADLIRPLRRRATLGPVAALRCERREFALRDDQGATLALLRDDKVTVRRGGLTTARYRQVLITPVGTGLDEHQLAWLDRAFGQSGANRVPKFPRLVTRLGAPATGPTDIPEPRPFDPAAPFSRFVSQLLALRLRRIVEADLAIRGGDHAGATRLAGHAAALRLELKGLSVVLDPDWVEDLYDELDWIVVESEPARDHDAATYAHLVHRLRSERYLTMLERLVSAVRSPQLADSPSISRPGGRPTAEVLTELRSTAVNRFRRSADALTIDAPDEQWSEALRALGQLQWVADLTGQLLTEQTERTEPLTQALTKPRRLLTAVQQDQSRVAETVASVAGLTAAEAFAAGRAYEQQVAVQRQVRALFLSQWVKSRKKLNA